MSLGLFYLVFKRQIKKTMHFKFLLFYNEFRYSSTMLSVRKHKPFHAEDTQDPRMPVPSLQHIPRRVHVRFVAALLGAAMEFEGNYIV